MKHNKGFTLIEGAIIFVIIGTITLIVASSMGWVNHSNYDNLTYGANGVVETRCIGGYQFVVGNRGQATQMIDSQGKGIVCKEKE